MHLALIPQFVDQNARGSSARAFSPTRSDRGQPRRQCPHHRRRRSIAIFLRRRPSWMRWQRWTTGTLLGAIGVKRALDTHTPATAG